MKREYLFIALFFLLPLSVFSENISEEEALLKAQAFMQQRGISNAKAVRVSTTGHSRRAPHANVQSDYYLFNIGHDEGFVIVGGDDRTPDILGYASSGSVNGDMMPDGLRYLLDGYSEQLAWMDEMGLSDVTAAMARSPQKAIRSTVLPLLSSHWNQGAPYNNLCPVISGMKTVTGCVATSMAQVVYYWKNSTDATTDIPGYELKTKDKDQQSVTMPIDGLEATTFDWDAMTPTYSSASTGPAADAVAKLMYYCGVSLEMRYGLSVNGGSSGFNATLPEALRDYWGYASANYAQRPFYTYEEWVDLIYNELASGRPVVLGGQSMGGGHSFVCDGYDTADYFHINWGWGGTSDGYFRLSLLNPEEQGFGGSSTLDGFSYGQDAVINISPTDIGIANGCLSLEMLGLGSDGTTSTMTVTRETEDGDFTGIDLSFILFNFKKATRSCDFALQLTDANGQVIETLRSGTVTDMAFNVMHTISLTGITIPTEAAPLHDGTYYIKVVSRPTGSEIWMPCYNSANMPIKAVVSDNTLTLTAPYGAFAPPASATLTVNGNLAKGYNQEVIASVTGGATDYHGNMFLRVNDDYVMGKCVDISANETVDVRFAFTPSAAGPCTIGLYTEKKDEAIIGEAITETIIDSDATNDLDLTFSYAIHNLNGENELYGNAFHATVTVTNPSADYSYAGRMNCSIRKWTSTVNDVEHTTTWGFESIGVMSYPLVVEKGGSTTIEVKNDNLEPGFLYSARITYTRSSASSGVADGIHIGLVVEPESSTGHGSLTVTNGFLLGDATGATTIHSTTEAISADDACFVDLRNYGSLDHVSITTGSNPNCLYLLPEGAAIPDDLSGYNVVCGTTAESLTLTDGHDFYTPIAFTAANATYARTFANAADGTSGWNTLFVPFEVSQVQCELGGETTNVDWFHSDSDTGKNFWLRAFTSDADGIVNFDHVAENVIAANTPYIIAVPDERWDTESEKWAMTGKPVTFKGSHAAIAATKSESVSGNHFLFCGHTAASTLSDVWLLNKKGSKFVKVSSGTPVHAFRAWFEPHSISSLTMPALTISNSVATGIVSQPVPVVNGNADTIYTLSGARLHGKPFKPGIYVMNGKKVVVK